MTGEDLHGLQLDRRHSRCLEVRDRGITVLEYVVQVGDVPGFLRHRGSHPLEMLDDGFAGGVAPFAVPSVRDLTSGGWLHNRVDRRRGRRAR
jgi:hypothetical protein